MLVMVSMPTNEMIRLVAMYPDVWFMDTPVGGELIQILKKKSQKINFEAGIS